MVLNQKSLRSIERGVKKISSSIIRESIKSGDMMRANSMLGRPYFLSGRIKKGHGRGKEMGWPTANLEIQDDRLIPQSGVYATKVKIQNCEYLSLTNIGVNPTFEDVSFSIETHISSFDKDIYHQKIEVQFFQKIRDEKKFSSVSELSKEIEHDFKKRSLLP